MQAEIKRLIFDSYRKNGADLWALARRYYPEFVYHDSEFVPSGTIPVFTFHSVEPARLERQLGHLAQNQYRSLTSEQAHDVISGRRVPEPKSVVLTFDDGLASLWSIAFPLLKRYGLNAIAFVIPGRIDSKNSRRLSLGDVWTGNAIIEDIVSQEFESPLCSWRELAEMHDSGIVEIQSHSHHHNTVFVSDVIEDFINPGFRPSFMCSAISPVIRRYGNDTFDFPYDLGLPVYKSAPALASSARYVEDEAISQHCVRYVRRNGGEEFFGHGHWRRSLEKSLREYESAHGNKGRFQTREERFDEMVADLGKSREIIEGNLGSSVRHLCYPWFRGSSLSVKASKAAGYISSYWGHFGKRTVNKVGDDPHHMVRMNDEYIFCLPGSGRISLGRMILDKVYRAVNRRNASVRTDRA